MRQPVLRDRILERARDVGLSDQIVKRLRSIFSGENLVAHSLNLAPHRAMRKQKWNCR
jgi:hypothetical protein